MEFVKEFEFDNKKFGTVSIVIYEDFDEVKKVPYWLVNAIYFIGDIELGVEVVCAVNTSNVKIEKMVSKEMAHK